MVTLEELVTRTKAPLKYLSKPLLADIQDDQKPVRVRIHVRNIQNIDTVQQRFDATLWVQFRWQTSEPPSKVDVAKMWRPTITFLDTIGTVSSSVSTYKENHPDDINMTYCFTRYVINATFAERFELHNFPWDVQRLHFRFMFYNCPHTIFLEGEEFPIPNRVKFYGGPCLIYKESFVQCDAWSLSDKLVLLQGRTPADRNGWGIQHVILGGYMTVKRYPAFYLWNVVMPTNMLVILAFSSYLMEELSDRLNITLTLLLTLVAFKLGINSYLPTTSYLTLLDKYSITSFVYLGVVFASNTVIFTVHDESANTSIGGVVSGFWVFLNLVWGVWEYMRFYKGPWTQISKDGAEECYDCVVDEKSE